MLLSSIMVETSFASITKPSVPQFTVKLVDSSYDIPTTYLIDPYTGANVTHPSHRVDNKTIELTIKNQPFVPYLVQEGNSNWTTSFYYNVRVKGHYKDDWITLYSAGARAKKRAIETPRNRKITVNLLEVVNLFFTVFTIENRRRELLFPIKRLLLVNG
jgi:hypothetical protein